MTDNFIQLKKENIVHLDIADGNGKLTGEYLEFDLDDIELPLKLQDMQEQHKKNLKEIQNKLKIIEKQEDHKGKKLLSANEEAKMKALEDFYKKEKDIYNIFLGERGVEKLLAGRKLGWFTLQEIDELINTQINPKLDISMHNIENKIREKYSNLGKKEDVLK